VSPNPSLGSIDLTVVGLAEPGARLRIHDLAGRLLRDWTLPGSADCAVHWDGHDSQGSEVSAGIYYAVVQSHGATRNAKVVLLR
jgi:hypothetical protein